MAPPHRVRPRQPRRPADRARRLSDDRPRRPAPPGGRRECATSFPSAVLIAVALALGALVVCGPGDARARSTRRRRTCWPWSRWRRARDRPGDRRRRSVRSSPMTSSSSSRIYTFTVHDPAEWLNLLLLLVVGIVVGRLAGRERDRAVAAIEGEREASAMFNISFTLAERARHGVGPRADRRDRARRDARQIASGSRSRTPWPPTRPASTAPPPTAPSVHVVLRRRPGDEPAEWVRVHAPGRGGKSGQDARGHDLPGRASPAGDRIARVDLGDPRPSRAR